jgi:hypothetical protein
VAGVAPQAGGDVGAPREAKSADGEVAPGGHGARCGAGPELGGVLGEPHVSDVVQGLDLAEALPWLDPYRARRVGGTDSIPVTEG